MRNVYPNIVMNEAGSEGSAGGKAAPDVSKLVEDNFKKLQEDLGKLSSRIEQVAKANATPPKPPKKQEEDEDSLEDLIIANPRKAVEKIKSQVLSSVNEASSAKDEFQAKFSELASEYPEIADVKSEVHARAKEIMESTKANQWDSGALERAVLRATAEKGVLPVKHRKKSGEENEDTDSGYLGGGSSSSGDRSRDQARRNKSDRLPSGTVALAELMGMDVKDPKVIERLTKRHNERKGNWNRYR